MDAACDPLVRDQDCPEVAQLLRPFSAGCIRNGFESETVGGGQGTQQVRKCKACVIGHESDIGDTFYTKPPFASVAQR